jgi:hypothetical protein
MAAVETILVAGSSPYANLRDIVHPACTLARERSQRRVGVHFHPILVPLGLRRVAIHVDIGEIKPFAGNGLVIPENADCKRSLAHILDVAAAVDIRLGLDYELALSPPDRRAPRQLQRAITPAMTIDRMVCLLCVPLRLSTAPKR